MWKCKKCGGTNFTETISGGSQSTIFDKEGNPKEVFDQDLEYDEVMCDRCDNTGESIQDIATWKGTK